MPADGYLEFTCRSEVARCCAAATYVVVNVGVGVTEAVAEGIGGGCSSHSILLHFAAECIACALHRMEVGALQDSEMSVSFN